MCELLCSANCFDLYQPLQKIHKTGEALLPLMKTECPGVIGICSTTLYKANINVWVWEDDVWCCDYAIIVAIFKVLGGHFISLCCCTSVWEILSQTHYLTNIQWKTSLACAVCVAVDNLSM